MNLRNLITLTKREIMSYFATPAAYVFTVIFLILVGFFTFNFGNFFQTNEANLTPFFQWHPWLYLFLVPAVGMHLWADERRLGTLELLFTMPVTPLECIVSKFVAAWIFVGVALALTFPIVLTVAYLGNPDGSVIFCSYVGSFLVAGSYLSIASMTSAFTRSQVVSFIISVVVCLFLIISGWPPCTDMLVNWAPRWAIDMMAACSVMPHFDTLQRGIIDSRDIIYFISIMVFALFCTSVVLKSHRAG